MRVVVVSLVLGIVSCSPSPEAADETGTSSTQTSGDASTSEETGSASDASTTDSGSTETGDAMEEVPARGVTIARVDANSGVAVTVARTGQWVNASSRNAPLPKNRTTALRAYLDVDESIWTPRDIEARVTMTQLDGTSIEQSSTRRIAVDSSEDSLESSFLFVIPAAHVQPGVDFQVELFEAGGDHEALPEPAEPATALVDGPQPLGIQPAFMELRVVIVPIDYDFDGCTTSIPTDELQPYADALFQHNPIESLDFSVRESILVDDLRIGTDAAVAVVDEPIVVDVGGDAVLGSQVGDPGGGSVSRWGRGGDRQHRARARTLPRKISRELPRWQQRRLRPPISSRRWIDRRLGLWRHRRRSS